MKKISMRKFNFTLVELLSAVAIIVILAGFLVSATSSAIRRAENAKTKTQITVLLNALRQYEATYGMMPTGKITDSTLHAEIFSHDSSAKVYKIKDDDGYKKLIGILQGKGGSADLQKSNPRKIKFLDIQGGESGVYEDKWGVRLELVFSDGTQDYIEADDLVPGIKAGSKIYTPVVIWSKGVDGSDNAAKSKISEKENRDNIYSFPVEYNKKEKYFELSN